MHKVLRDGLRVGIKSLMATVRGPGLKNSGVAVNRVLGLQEATAEGGCTVVSALVDWSSREI